MPVPVAPAPTIIDLHVYPRLYDTNGELASFEIPASRQKPLLLGEFGANRQKFGQNITQAALAMRDFQVLTCRSYGFAGWLLWTWDTTEQPELYNALDTNGAINGVLAPIVRPDPCTA